MGISRGAGVLIVATLVSGCQYATGGSHIELSDQVRDHMRRMESMVYERELTDPELTEYRRRLARQLASDMRRVSSALSEEEFLPKRIARTRFVELTERLLSLSGEVDRLAEATSGVEVQTTFRAVSEACEQCHREFR